MTNSNNYVDDGYTKKKPNYVVDSNGKVRKILTESELKKQVTSGNSFHAGLTAGWNKNVAAEIAKKEKNNGWFKESGADNVLGAIGGTLADAGQSALAGALSLGETVLDTALAVAPYIAQGQYYQNGGGYQSPTMQQQAQAGFDMAKQGNAEIIAKDLYNEQDIANKLIAAPIKVTTGFDIADASVFGNKMDGVMQSGGQLLGTAALSMAGVPWWLTTGASSYGAQAETALNEGATLEEANVSGLISAGAEILTEKLSGGISFGGKTLDDALTAPLMANISNKAWRTIAKLSGDVAGEGLEEIGSQVISNLGTALYKEENLGEILLSEEALQEYIDSFIGGAILGGASGSAKVVTSAVKGNDFVTGNTVNEQKVIDMLLKDRITEAGDTKLSAKEKAKLYEEATKDLEKGRISIDTIEKTLGGSTYEKYQSILKEESALKDEISELENLPKEKITVKQAERLKEAREQLAGMDVKSIKEQLNKEVAKIASGDRLSESYKEISRRREHFEADLTQYDVKQRDTVQRAIDSGILNNTNKTHDFVDMIAKISADKGVSFDFANNEKLKESGFALEGRTVNGYVMGGDITLNINSAKALNKVVGHEITHVLEGTELYGELQNLIIEYAKSKGEYKSRLESLEELYKDIEDADITAELTADLVGDYLFSDTDFINRLSVEQPNIFKKIFEEIKYLVKTATAGTKEAKQLLEVQRAFEKAYKEGGESKDGIRYSLAENAATELHKALYDKNYREDVRLRDETPAIMLAQKGVKNLPMVMKVSHIRENVFTEEEAKKLGLRVDAHTHYHGLGEEFFLKVIDGLDDVDLAYRGTKKAADASRRENYFLLVSKLTGEAGNTVNVPVYIDEHAQYNRVFVDVNKISTVFGRDNFDEYIRRQVRENNLVRIKNRSIQSSERNALIAKGYREDTSIDSISQTEENATKNSLSLAEDDVPIRSDIYGKDIALDVPIREDAGQTQETVTGEETNKYLKAYPEHQKENWKNSKNIIVYENDLQLQQFISDAKAHNIPGKKMYFGKVADVVAERVMNELGYDITDYNCSIKADEVEKIFKSHGNEESENARGQRAVTDNDFKRIPEVMGTPEQIEYAGAYKGKPAIKFVKDGHTVIAVMSDKHLDLYVQTMYLGQKNRSLATPIDETPLSHTPEARSGTAPIDIIPQTAEKSTSNLEGSPIREQNETVSGENETNLEGIEPVEGEVAPVQPKEDTTSMSDLKETVAADAGKKLTRKELHLNIMDNISNTFAEKGYNLDDVLSNAKNLSTFQTVDNTPQRVLEKALGYKEGQLLSDLTVNQVAQNETKGIQWLNSFTDRKNGFLAKISKQYNIKPRSKESAAAQMYAEGFYVNEKNEIVSYGDKELAQDFKDENVRENIKALAHDPRIRQVYDETLKSINDARVRNAYPEIPRLDNYFLHFRAMNDTFSRLGLPFNPQDIRAKDLPTDLNGVTADLKPGKPYFASENHRRGKRTDFDLLYGLEQYLTAAKNQIYHIDDIQTLRALRNHIANRYGQASLEGLDTMGEEELQERLSQIYGSHLSTFAKFLNEEANILAGKTSLIDRGLEGIIGRRGITFLNDVNKQVGSNMVGFNVSSAGTNFLPVVQTLAKSNKLDFLKAMVQTVSGKVSAMFGGERDGFTQNSPVCIRRKGADRFYRTPYQKAADAGYFLMSAVDDISTEIIARTKYNEFLRKGMDSQRAHIETDKWASRLMGDRSLGQMPQLYNSKMLGLLTKFQLEVRNQLDSQFYDTIQDARVSTEYIEGNLKRNMIKTAKITATFFQLAALQHIFGKAYESVAGYNPAFDIIEVMTQMFGWDDEEDSEDGILDNVEQGFLTLLEDLPYTSTFTGGRIPISSALPIKEIITGVDEYGNDKNRLETLGEAAPYYVLPGGYGQIRKTIQGLSMFDDDLPIAGSYTDTGNLRFPVDDTIGNRVQAAVFGQWASKNAQDYFENGRKPLESKQIEEFKDLDLPIADYWKYREELKELETTADKIDFIASLDLPDEKKNIMANNVVNRKEPIDLSDYDDYASFEEFDWAIKNPEKYKFLQDIDISYKVYSANDDSKEAYTWAFENPEKYEVSKVVTDDVVKYRKYLEELNSITADRTRTGNIVQGSAKKKKLAYINGLDLEYGQKIILFKSIYESDDYYNYDIVEYLNGREELSYNDICNILRELGFHVGQDGRVTW